MKNIVKLGVTLFGICAVAATSLAFVNQVTAPIIEQRNIQANDEARKVVLADATEFALMEGVTSDVVTEVYEGKNGSEVVGYTMKTLPKGYGGEMEVIVGISADGKVTGVDIGNNAETPGLGSKAAEPDFTNQFLEKSIDSSLMVVKGKATSESDIVAISGATISSAGVTNGVNAAIKIFNEQVNGDGTSEAKEDVNPLEAIFTQAKLEEIEAESAEGLVKVHEAKEDDKLVGYIFETETNGYDSKSEVIVGIDLDGIVKGVELGENTRKNEYFTPIFDNSLKPQFEGVKNEEVTLVDEKTDNKNEIQAVSGATVSVTSVVDGVNIAIEAFNNIVNKAGV